MKVIFAGTPDFAAAALRAIAELRKYQLDVQLRAYQSPHDGGWYLTSQYTTED